MRLSGVCLIVPLFLIILSVSDLASGVERYKGEGTQLTGQVFLYQQGEIQDSRPFISDIDEKRLPGMSLPQRVSGQSLSRDAGSDRIKLIGKALDEGGMASDVLANGNYCYIGTTGSMIGFDVKLKANEKITIQVVMTPGSKEKPIKLDIKNVENWSQPLK